MVREIDLSRAIELVGNAIESHARQLAGRYGMYSHADELRLAFKKVRTSAMNNSLHAYPTIHN